MFQFFVEPWAIGTITGTITGSDVNHIKNVLRMKKGEQVRISDNQGQDYLGEICEIEEEQVIVTLLEHCANTELPVKVTLFQGLPKNDKMELIIQKAVELGVYQIIPVAMKNCVVKLDEKKAKNKITRWQTISESAAKQSKRSIIPKIGEIMTFPQATAYAASLDVSLIPYENQRGMANTRQVMSSIVKGSSVGILIGPEGGFSKNEIASVQENSQLISLGNRILRTETAGMAAMSMLIFALEE
ncbi:MAG: 16S rRNA (uracil(1498)-N(3))-methyltransferase [Lachnospiraceae bacterium]